MTNSSHHVHTALRLAFPVSLSLCLLVGTALAGCAATPAAPDAASAPAVPRPPAADALGPYVIGIDASRYQGAVNWADLRAAGVAFVYLKASEGESVRNAYFEQHRDAARAAGIRWGAYHFVRPEVAPEAQVALLVSVLETDGGDLPPVLDVETDGGLAPDLLRAHVLDLAARVEAETGRRPMLYTGASFYRDRLAPALDGYPLWVAQYRDTLPEVGRPWTLWQFTDSVRLRGVGNQPVSLSVFRGTPADLDALGARTPGPE